MTEVAKPTIRANVERLLAVLGINGVEFTDESHPDRLFGFDRNRNLLAHCMRYRGAHWSEDHGPEIKHFHGRSAFASFRENASPSMQCVFHAISDASPEREDLFFVELDVDHSAPTNLVKLIIHGEEVLVNAVTHATTDQVDISRRLDERLKGQNDGHSGQVEMAAQSNQPGGSKGG